MTAHRLLAVLVVACVVGICEVVRRWDAARTAWDLAELEREGL